MRKTDLKLVPRDSYRGTVIPTAVHFYFLTESRRSVDEIEMAPNGFRLCRGMRSVHRLKPVPPGGPAGSRRYQKQRGRQIPDGSTNELGGKEKCAHPFR